jgi:hypothetical protein
MAALKVFGTAAVTAGLMASESGEWMVASWVVSSGD